MPNEFFVPRQMPELPPVRDFLTSAGFAGAAALLAAIIVALVAMFGARRATRRHRLELETRQRHHEDVLNAQQYATDVDRIWQRLVWVVETAGLEPGASENATLGLGPEMALELLRGLLADAEQVGDDTLARAVSVYLEQFSLVLAQQSGSSAELFAPATPDTRYNGSLVPITQGPAHADDDPVHAAQQGSVGRRRRAQ